MNILTEKCVAFSVKTKLSKKTTTTRKKLQSTEPRHSRIVNEPQVAALNMHVCIIMEV